MSRQRGRNAAKRKESARAATGWRLPENLSFPPRPSLGNKVLLAGALLLQTAWMAFLAAMVVCK